MTTFATKPARVPRRTYDWGGISGTVKAVAFFPDGKRIATAGHDDTSTRIWDLDTGDEDGECLSGWHSTPTLSVAISKHGKEIVTGGSDGQVLLWNAESRTLSQILRPGPPGEQVRCVAFNTPCSPMLVASSGSDGVVSIWKPGPDEYSKPFKQIVIPNHPTVSSIAFAPSFPGVNCIAVASFDKKVRIYDIYKGGDIPLATFEPHSLDVSSLAWFPAGQQLVSAGDKTVNIWDTQVREKDVHPRTLVGHCKIVKTVAVSPDGRFVASGSSDGTLRLWNAVTGAQIGPPLPIADLSSEYVDIVAFSPDGKALLSITKDRGHLWDMDYLEVEEGMQLIKLVVSNLIASSAEQQRKMREAFRDEMDELRQTHEQKVEDLRRELERDRREEAERFSILQAAHRAAMEKQEEDKTAWEAEFSRLRSELLALGQTHEQGLKGLEDANEVHKKGLKAFHSAQKQAEGKQEQGFDELKQQLLELTALLTKKPATTFPFRSGAN